MKLKPKDFVEKYYPEALKVEIKTGINAKLILAQAAIESNWAGAAPGNMFFGIKDTDGVNGNEQLIITTEYSTRNNLHFPEIISITPVIRNGKKMFKYIVKDYFRKYNTHEESFADHANFFLKNKRYEKALMFKSDANKFASAIAAAGYATDPNYATLLHSVIETVERYI